MINRPGISLPRDMSFLNLAALPIVKKTCDESGYCFERDSDGKERSTFNDGGRHDSYDDNDSSTKYSSVTRFCDGWVYKTFRDTGYTKKFYSPKQASFQVNGGCVKNRPKLLMLI